MFERHWKFSSNPSYTSPRLVVKMSKPDIRVNSFFKKQSYYLDPISKFYIITEMTLGLNHLELFQNIKSILVRIGYVYCVVSSVTFYYLTFDSNLWLTFPIVTTIDIVSYFLTITISSLLWKRLRSYYMELSSFDAEVGCEIKLSYDQWNRYSNVCPMPHEGLRNTFWMRKVEVQYALFLF